MTERNSGLERAFGFLSLAARELGPDVIIYDIALPYEENWTFFRLLQTSESLKAMQWVLTTTHRKRLMELVGEVGEVHEIVGKPYDLKQIVDAVKAALSRAEPSSYP